MAWEKKLYMEVKERERMQLLQDKTLKELRDQEYSRKINVDIQKLKPAWDRARAQLNAASQAVDASSSAIYELRDTHLACQVLGLCHPRVILLPVAAEFAAFVDGWGKCLNACTAPMFSNRSRTLLA
jgi:hypothetical protein